MSIIKTDAIVLRSMKYGDSSKIVTIFTKDFGKLDAIVKGVRNYKSKYCGILETLNYVSLVIYKKENRNIQLISSAEYKKSFNNISSNLDKVSTAFRIIEILDKSTYEIESNEKIFELVVEVLTSLNNARTNFDIFLLYFEIKLIKLLGISPIFENESDTLERETFNNDFAFNLNNKQKAILIKFFKEKLADIMKLEVEENEIGKLISACEKYLIDHIDSSKNFRAKKIVQELTKLF